MVFTVVCTHAITDISLSRYTFAGWGWNFYGKLGDGSTTDQIVPTAVSGGGVWSQISGGLFHTCGVKSDGSAWCEFSWYLPSFAASMLSLTSLFLVIYLYYRLGLELFRPAGRRID